MQAGINIIDGTGSEVLEQMNNALETLASNFSGSSEPAETYAGMTWLDTSGTNPVKKERNADNTDWIVLGTFIDDVFYNADRATIQTVTITLGTTWTGSEAPFTQEVSVSGMLATDNPQAGIILSSTYATATEQLKEYAKIFRAVTSAGKVTFYAKEATTVDLSIQLKIIR